MCRPAVKRQKGNELPAPRMVTRGSAFTADVWQNAVLLVDKPQGWTSFDVCGKLRGALKVKKVRRDMPRARARPVSLTSSPHPTS